MYFWAKLWSVADYKADNPLAAYYVAHMSRSDVSNRRQERDEIVVEAYVASPTCFSKRDSNCVNYASRPRTFSHTSS